MQPEKFWDAARVAADVASAAWRRFLRGPSGSIGIVRWVGTWAAYTFLALVSVAAVFRERPQQVTLWWLLLLARLVGNVAAAAREQKRHDPRAWAGIVLVFFISGMAVPSAWQGVGLALLIAAAIHSQPLEQTVILAQRAASWTTAALIWVGAWTLLTNLGLAAVEPVTRVVNQHGGGVFSVALLAASAALSAGSALLVLWLVVCSYRWLHEQQGEVI